MAAVRKATQELYAERVRLHTLRDFNNHPRTSVRDGPISRIDASDCHDDSKCLSPSAASEAHTGTSQCTTVGSRARRYFVSSG